MNCYACDDQASGTRDRSYDAERAIVPACDRHRDSDDVVAAGVSARTGARAIVRIGRSRLRPYRLEVAGLTTATYATLERALEAGEECRFRVVNWTWEGDWE